MAFSTLLTGLSSNFYETAFAKYLLHEFWDVAQREIILKQFVPYIVFMCIAVYSFHLALDSSVLNQTDRSESDVIVAKSFGAFTLLCLPYFIMTEVKQFKVEKDKMKYFMSGWNWVDNMSLMLTLIITLHTVFDLDAIPA